MVLWEASSQGDLHSFGRKHPKVTSGSPVLYSRFVVRRKREESLTGSRPAKFYQFKNGMHSFLLFFRWHFMWPKMDSIDSMMTYQGYVFWSLCFWCLEFGDSGTQSDLWKNTSPCGEILHWSQTLRSLSASALDANDPRSYQWSSWCFMFGRSNYEKNIAGFRCQSDWIPGIRCIYSPQVWHVFWAGHCVDFTRAWETTIVDLRKRE